MMEAKLGQVKKLMEDLGVSSLEELMKVVSDLRKENELMEQEKKMSERKTQLDKLLEEGKISAAQKEAGVKLSEEGFKGFVEMVELSEPTVKFSEEGENTTPKEEKEETDIQDQLIKLAETKMKEEKELSFSEATRLVLNENVELAEKYNNVLKGE